jgi:hypothetical protein
MAGDERADVDVDALWDQVMDEVEELKAAGTIPADTHIYDPSLNGIKATLKLAVRGKEFYSRFYNADQFEYDVVEGNHAYSDAKRLSTWRARFAALRLVNLVATELTMYAAYPGRRGDWQHISKMSAMDADENLRKMAGTYPYPVR